jgi:hypothetical protein
VTSGFGSSFTSTCFFSSTGAGSGAFFSSGKTDCERVFGETEGAEVAELTEPGVPDTVPRRVEVVVLGE